MIRVALAGATGKMGRQVVRAVSEAPDMELVAAVARNGEGADAGVVAGLPPLNVPIRRDLEAALREAQPDVMVDFTAPEGIRDRIETALRLGVPAVVGTTGLSAEDVAHIDELARGRGLGVLIAPNFSTGAVLMMRFAREAARHMERVEIIELHHDQKKDAPSGTALQTAEMLAAQLGRGTVDARAAAELAAAGTQVEAAGAVAARGSQVGPVRIHSVRLPGLVAHQEVLFGGPGQVLTIRHDALDRSCFMPGVLLGIRRVRDWVGVVYGLEPLLFPEDSK